MSTMNWDELQNELNDACFDAFNVDAIINSEVVSVIWQGEQKETDDYGDVMSTSIKIEIAEQDKAKFTKGSELVYQGQTFSVFRKPIRNLESGVWEVELEP